MVSMIIDSFAGGGGASTGIERALGRSPDVAAAVVRANCIEALAQPRCDKSKRAKLPKILAAPASVASLFGGAAA